MRGAHLVVNQDPHGVLRRVEKVVGRPALKARVRHHRDRDRNARPGARCSNLCQARIERREAGNKWRHRVGRRVSCLHASQRGRRRRRVDRDQIALEDDANLKIGVAARDDERLDVEALHAREALVAGEVRLPELLGAVAQRERVLLGLLAILKREDDMLLRIHLHRVDGLLLRVGVKDEHPRARQRLQPLLHRLRLLDRAHARGESGHI